MFIEFSDELKKVLNYSKNEMFSLKHSYIGTEHIILAILSFENSICSILNQQNITYTEFKNKVIEHLGIGEKEDSLFVYTPLLKKIIDKSFGYSTKNNLDKITLPLFFSLLLDEGEGVAYRIFCEYNVDFDMLKEMISFDSYSYDANQDILKNVGVILSSDNFENKIYGRDREIEKIIEILLRKTKCNPLLLGDAGVGKTAIVEELARKINIGDVPNKLLNKKIVSISMAGMVSGTKYRGEFEEKLLNVINYAEKNNIILFIDEIHTLVGAGGADGAIDASNILKPALARGNIKIIGATTNEEYKKFIEKDKALSRRFQNILIEEPNEEMLYNILVSTKKGYEYFHNVNITNDLLKYIMDLSRRYITNRKEPDRSIDILDEACSKTAVKPSLIQIKNSKLKHNLEEIKRKKDMFLSKKNYKLAMLLRKKEREIESEVNLNDIKMLSDNKPKKVTKDIINKIISEKCNVYIDNSKNIDRYLKRIKMKLSKEVIAQSKAIDSTITYCKNIFNCDYKNDRPLTLMFYGSTGVGKTLLAERIGQYLFNNNVIKLDLSELNDLAKFGVNETNNVFLNMIKDKPINLIILKNFDKCHYKVKNIILKMLKTGHYEDSNGFKYNLSNSLFILITNKISKELIGFQSNNNKIEMDEDINLKKIMFNDLTYEDMVQIVKTKLENSKKNINLIKEIIYNSEYLTNGAKKVDYYLKDSVKM